MIASIKHRFVQDDDGHWYLLTQNAAEALEKGLHEREFIVDDDRREEAIEDLWHRHSSKRCESPEFFTFENPEDVR